MNQSSSGGGHAPSRQTRPTNLDTRGALDPARLLEGVSVIAGPARAEAAMSPRSASRLSPASVRRITAELRAAAGRIFANWVVRVTNLPHYRAQPDVRLSDLKTGMPELVIAAIDALTAHDPTLRAEPNAAAAAAVTLSRSRAAHGCSLSDILAELQELRVEFFAAFWRMIDSSPTSDLLGSAPRELMERFIRLGGELLIAVSQDWVSRLEGQYGAGAQAIAGERA